MYKLAVVSLKSQQKFSKRNFLTFVVTPSISLGTPQHWLLGFCDIN